MDQPRANLAYSGFSEGLLELLEEAEAAGGRGVSSVHEGVDEDVGELVLGGHAEERVEMALVRVDATVGEETEEVEGAALLSGATAGISGPTGVASPVTGRWRRLPIS